MDPGVHPGLGEREAAAEPPVRRGLARKRAARPLAARPEQQRLAERVEQRQRIEQGEVLGHRFAEADARIEDHLLAPHAGIDRPVARRGEPVEHLEHDVAVSGLGVEILDS